MTASVSSFPLQERALLALQALPPLSPILHRVIASLAHEDVSFAKVAELIEKDTVLAGNILKLVNSPLYGLRASVSSVRHAVSLLGVQKLRNAVLGVAAAQMWRWLKTPPDWSMSNFNRHSVSVAILADLIAQRLPLKNGNGAFVAGLFHDLGLLLIAIGLPAQYKQISAFAETEPARIRDVEIEILGTTHADLSADALSVWNLPEPIRTAVRYHIRPEADPDDARLNGITLSRVLHAADAYIVKIGERCCGIELGTGDADQALESLGLGDKISGIISDFDNEFAAIQPYF